MPVGWNYVGEAEPTGTVGDCGWIGNCIWAVVDHLSRYIGADQCPDDADKCLAGVCGCGVPETDADGDAVPDCNDNYPQVLNADQADGDADGVGDVHDDFPAGGGPGRVRSFPGCGFGVVSMMMTLLGLGMLRLARPGRRGSA